MNYEIITPVVTAFNKNEEIDYKANERIIDFLIEGGVNGILVLGSAGEFTGLSYEEKKEFFKFYSEYVDGRIDLYAGTGSMSFDETVALSNDVKNLNYKGAVVIGPYYYNLDQEKIFIYYDKLAKSVNGSVYLYNFPARTGYSINHKTIKKLVNNNSNIIGLKDSVSEPVHTNLCILETREDNFDVFSGFDDQFLYNIAAGGKGCISALSNIVPEIWSELVKAANEGRFDKSINYQSLIQELMPLYNMDSNFSYLFKLLMVYRGVELNPTAIFPFNQIDKNIINKSKDILDAVLEKFNKIK
jgi:4-hydroxy-tetrahydrodipicolinate synthase